MTTLSPMLACGPCVGPEILIVFIPWLVGIVAALANLVAICLSMSKPSPGFGNLVFFLSYVGLGATFCAGAFGFAGNDRMIALFFGIPVLPIGHSVFMFASRLWRRKKLREQNGENKLPTT